MIVEILSTGDELLTGQVVDTNSTWLMDRLWDLGVMVRRKTLVGDDRADLDAALRETTGRADLVVMSGGMGPTEDDLTAECVAAGVFAWAGLQFLEVALRLVLGCGKALHWWCAEGP